MKPKLKVKWVALCCMLLAATLLGGCVANQNQTDKSGTAGAGYSGDLPFDILQYTTVPPVSPSATIGFDINLPSPEVSGGIPFGVDSQGVPGIVTPTPYPDGTATLPPTMPPTASPVPSPTPLILKLGSTGAEVRTVQSRLRELGYMHTIDGDFGKGTENAIKAFQTRNKLRADGVVGPSTMAKLNAANAVRAPITPAPTKATATHRPTATPRVNANLYLKMGDQGAEVRRMQNRLIDLGYLSGTATGQFNSATEAAVIAFQKRNVSYSDGIAGPMTLSKLYSNTAVRSAGGTASIGISLKIGMKDSEPVRTMQRRLKDLRYYTGAIDGDFGNSTEIAVKAFQTNNRLTVDGKAGEETLNLLYSNKARSAGSAAPATPNAPRVTPIPDYTPIINYVNVTPSPDGNYVTLEYGDGGILVQNLQQALKTRGYFSGTVDGKYGLATLEAVIRFQQDYGLSQDGKAGAATQRVLYEGNYPQGS